MNVLYLSLKTFSNTGGIEQVNRNWLFELNEFHQNHLIRLKAISLYDQQVDGNYIDPLLATCYAGNKFLFFIKSIWQGIKSDVIILPHINLALIGLLIKLFNPRAKVFLQTHGIEVWYKLSGIKERLLFQADKILPVSKFTKEVLLKKYNLNENNIKVVSNYLSPIVKYNFDKEVRDSFRSDLGITNSVKLIITVGRLSSDEQYKGYDAVIESLRKLKDEFKFMYHIIGNYDEIEFNRIQSLIQVYNLNENVKLTGYVSDELIVKYYQAADLFVMPSKGEGFGLVFIDAMANGLEVIAGNKDGSLDALNDGMLGQLVDPENNDEITNAIVNALHKPFDVQSRISLSNEVNTLFNHQKLNKQLLEILEINGSNN